MGVRGAASGTPILRFAAWRTERSEASARARRQFATPRLVSRKAPSSEAVLRFRRQLVRSREGRHERFGAWNRLQVRVVPNGVSEHERPIPSVSNAPRSKPGPLRRLQPTTALPHIRTAAPHPMAVDPNDLRIRCRGHHFGEASWRRVRHEQVLGTRLTRLSWLGKAGAARDAEQGERETRTSDGHGHEPSAEARFAPAGAELATRRA